MKTVEHYAKARDKVLHIETEGAVINITVGLTDRHGRAVTSVEFIPDGPNRGGDAHGRVWDLSLGHNTRLIRRHEDGEPYISDEHQEVLAAAQEAANAAGGDSNDREISALQEALDAALSALGLTMPEAEEPDDEED